MRTAFINTLCDLAKEDNRIGAISFTATNTVS